MKIVLAYDSLEDIRMLFREYADSLGIDLCFQSFNNELNTLPGRYALPGGRLYIAYDGETAAGCVALRPLDGGLGEMKRLYVRPAYRKTGLGETLARQIISDAESVGCGRIVLDTLETMKPAIALYRKLGFEVVEPYYDNPVPGAVYMSMELKETPAKSEAE